MKEVVDTPLEYVCHICGKTFVKPSPESLSPGVPSTPPGKVGIQLGLFYVCDACKKVVCEIVRT